MAPITPQIANQVRVGGWTTKSRQGGTRKFEVIHSFRVIERHLLSSTALQPTQTQRDHLPHKPQFMMFLQIRCASRVLYDSLESEREFNFISWIEVTARGDVILVPHRDRVWFFSPAFIDCDVRGRSPETDEDDGENYMQIRKLGRNPIQAAVASRCPSPVKQS